MQPSRPVLAVLFVLLLGVATSVTPAGPGQGKVSEPSDGRWVAYTVAEDPQVAEDLNFDGDLSDDVLHIFDAATGATTNVALAVAVRLLEVERNWVAFGLPQGQGSAHA